MNNNSEEVSMVMAGVPEQFVIGNGQVAATDEANGTDPNNEL